MSISRSGTCQQGASSVWSCSPCHRLQIVARSVPFGSIGGVPPSGRPPLGLLAPAAVRLAAGESSQGNRAGATAVPSDGGLGGLRPLPILGLRISQPPKFGADRGQPGNAFPLLLLRRRDGAEGVCGPGDFAGRRHLSGDRLPRPQTQVPCLRQCAAQPPGHQPRMPAAGFSLRHSKLSRLS